MATQPQLIANRLNARKSSGPRSHEGKALASKNSLKHGLSACRDVITTESQEEFDRHRDALLSELTPQTPMESILADRIVSLSWRLKRADQIQNQTFDALHEDNTNNPLANLGKSFALKGLGLLQPDPADSNPNLTLGRLALKDFSNERVLDRLLMYERRIEHSLFKTTLELQRLRLLRNLEPPIPHSQQNLAPGFTGGSPQKSTDNPLPPSPPFSRRRDDDALTPNSTPLHASRTTLHASRNIKNEPNFQKPKTAATTCPTNSYNNIPPHPPQENEPNLVAAQPLAKPDRTQFRDMQYAARCTPYANLALADTEKTTTIAPVSKTGSIPGRDEKQRKHYFKENRKK